MHTGMHVLHAALRVCMYAWWLCVLAYVSRTLLRRPMALQCLTCKIGQGLYMWTWSVSWAASVGFSTCMAQPLLPPAARHAARAAAAVQPPVAAASPANPTPTARHAARAAPPAAQPPAPAALAAPAPADLASEQAARYNSHLAESIARNIAVNMTRWAQTQPSTAALQGGLIHDARMIQAVVEAASAAAAAAATAVISAAGEAVQARLHERAANGSLPFLVQPLLQMGHGHGAAVRQQQGQMEMQQVRVCAWVLVWMRAMFGEMFWSMQKVWPSTFKFWL